MKNAHLRFGWLTYFKRTEKTTTTFKLRLDRFVGEVLPDAPRRAKAHFISVIGCDPVLIKGHKSKFLSWLCQGVSDGKLLFPQSTGRVKWPRIGLRVIFQPSCSDVATESSANAHL